MTQPRTEPDAIRVIREQRVAWTVEMLREIWEAGCDQGYENGDRASHGSKPLRSDDDAFLAALADILYREGVL